MEIRCTFNTLILLDSLLCRSAAAADMESSESLEPCTSDNLKIHHKMEQFEIESNIILYQCHFKWSSIITNNNYRHKPNSSYKPTIWKFIEVGNDYLWILLGGANTPYFGLQLKYSLPFTVPLFLPTGLSSSIPYHRPGAKSVSPQYLITPLRCPATNTLSPISKSSGPPFRPKPEMARSYMYNPRMCTGYI